jgi:Fur family transcriptional regulator, peroxide stress response regulator
LQADTTCIFVSYDIYIYSLPVNSAEKQLRLEQFAAAHRESGLPITIQRRAVFEAILDRGDHPSADQVYTAVRDDLPQISRMTVHRILGTFVTLGLLVKTCHPGSVTRYDPNLQQHHHLVCMDCGCIIDIQDTRLNQLPWPKVDAREFTIQDYHVHFRGQCARCLKKSSATRHRPSAKRTPGNSTIDKNNKQREGRL